MNRLEQDAADTLQAHEQRQAWADRVKADLARSQQKATGPNWKPTLTEQERAEREQQIKAGLIPF